MLLKNSVPYTKRVLIPNLYFKIERPQLLSEINTSSVVFVYPIYIFDMFNVSRVSQQPLPAKIRKVFFDFQTLYLKLLLVVFVCEPGFHIYYS